MITRWGLNAAEELNMTMSELETGVPESPRMVTLQVVPALDDHDESALVDMTADRDAWQAAAKNLQSELWRQMDVMRDLVEKQKLEGDLLRAELEQQRVLLSGFTAEGERRDGQIAHLNSAMTALIALANSRPEPIAATVPTVPTAPTAPTAPAAALQAPAARAGFDVPPGMEGLPSTQPPAPPVDPNAPPMVIPSVAPDLRPKPKNKLRTPPAAAAKQPVAADPASSPAAAAAPVAEPEPVVEALPPVQAVEFTAPVPETGGGNIIPADTNEKKRRGLFG
jgi:hypothetical protein